MNVALTVDNGQDDQLIFAQQLGIEHVVVEIRDWSITGLTSRLEGVVNRATQTGLELAAVSGLFLSGNEPDGEVLARAEQAGIAVVSCRIGNPMPVPERQPVGRGDALVGQIPSDPVSTDLLANVREMAQKTGVRLAVVADAATGIGVVEALSEGEVGVDLDVAASEPDHVALLAETDRILLVHIGNRTVPDFQKTFIDEGSVPRMVRLLQRIGFDGLLRAVGPPGMVDDTTWGHKGRAFDAGYLKGILQTLG